MYREQKRRSIAKSISYRICGSLATALLVYAFTDRPTLALGIGGIDAFVKMVVYFWHERAWAKVSYGRVFIEPKVIWLTGLSGSGKSTIGQVIARKIRERGLKCEYLDGDTIRDLMPGTGFSKAERDQHIKRVGFLASRLEQNNVFVVASFVSPYRDARDFVRGLCKNFVEIHISTPLEECEKRDVKGLYAKARRGEIKNFTGISDPYEPPLNPEISLDTSKMTEAEAVARVLAAVEGKNGR